MPLDRQKPSPAPSSFHFPDRSSSSTIGTRSTIADPKRPATTKRPVLPSDEQELAFGIPRSDSANRLAADLGPSLSSVLHSFDFSNRSTSSYSPHSSFQSSSAGEESDRSRSGESSSYSTNPTTNPSTPALGYDKDAPDHSFTKSIDNASAHASTAVSTGDNQQLHTNNTTEQPASLHYWRSKSQLEPIAHPTQPTSPAKLSLPSRPAVTHQSDAPATTTAQHTGTFPFSDTPPVVVASASDTSSSSPDSFQAQLTGTPVSGLNAKSIEPFASQQQPGSSKNSSSSVSSTSSNSNKGSSTSARKLNMPVRSQVSSSSTATATVERWRERMQGKDVNPHQARSAFSRRTHSRRDSSSSSGGGGFTSAIHTPSDSISPIYSRSQSRQRSESMLSTATSATYATGILANATITTASSATIRRVEKADVTAKPIRLSSLPSKDSLSATEGETHESSLFLSSAAGDGYLGQSAFSNTDSSFETGPVSTDSSFVAGSITSSVGKQLAPLEPPAHTTGRARAASNASSRTGAGAVLGLPEGTRLGSMTNGANSPARSMVSLEDGSTSGGKPTPRARPMDISPHAPSDSRSSRNGQEGIGLGIGTGSSPSFSRPNLGLALDVVPESSNLETYQRKETGASLIQGRGRGASVSTTLSVADEPAWGQNSQVATTAADPTLSSLAAFAFPSPVVPSSVGSATATPTPASIAQYPQPRAAPEATSAAGSRLGSMLHSTTPSLQSFVSATSNGLAPSTGFGGGHSRFLTGTTSLSVASQSHAPASSSGGSMMSAMALSQLGLSQNMPTNREDMLSRLLLDQARVDTQDYGLMSLEDVAEAKRDLKQLERKLAGLKTKLKVETRIRDAAVALRRAHRRTPSAMSSATGAGSASVAPSSPGRLSASPEPGNLSIRSRSTSMSANEAKAEEDVAAAAAKVDKVTREILRLSEKANQLRRRILEHQAAALADRVATLEADRAMLEEKLPLISASASHDSLAPSASASAAGSGLGRVQENDHDRTVGADDFERRRLRSLKRQDSDRSDAPYEPRGPTYPVRHDRLESDLSAISGFSFLDATAPEKVKILSAELESARRQLDQTNRELNQMQTQIKNHRAAAEEQRVLAEKEFDSQRTSLEKQLEEERQQRTKLMQLSSSLDDHVSKTNAVTEELKSLRTKHRLLEQEAATRAASLETEKRAVELLKAQLEKEAAAHAASLDSERRAVESLKRQLEEEQRARAAAEAKIAEAVGQANESKTHAAKSEAGLRELELAVGAERKIMAERDELFHAFERRLESAEKRLQEQDKRCARMLGKLEGREEMDDLLERIKAGANGVAKKKKTAGQDIADLLTSLEMHIEDLEDELSRSSGAAMHGSPALRRIEEELEATEREAQRWKAEAEEARSELEELRSTAARSEPATAPETIVSQEQLDKLRNLEETVEQLTTTNAELQRQIRSSNTLPKPRSSTGPGNKTVTRSASGASGSGGVSSLINKFGGGARADASPAKSDFERELPSTNPVMDEHLREFRAAIEAIAAAIPTLDVKAAPKTDLQALQRALEPPLPALPRSRSDVTSVSVVSGSGAVSAEDLRRELDSVADKVRMTLSAVRASIAQAVAQEPGPGSDEKAKVAEEMRDEYKRSMEDLKLKLKKSVESHREKERKLEQSVNDLRDQLSKTRSSQCLQGSGQTGSSTSPSLLSSSSLGLSTSPGQAQTWGMAHTYQLSPARRAPPPLSVGVGGGRSPVGGMLAPPRSPLGDGLPSPTRSVASSVGSSSLRYIPPFATALDARSSPTPRAADGTASDSFDTFSVRSGSSPASTTTGLPGSSGPPSTAASSVLARQQGGNVPRTIALGMDVPQLVTKVRELERELQQTSALRKHAERVNELEIELRNAHRSYAALTKRVEEEKELDMQQRVQMLDELNEAQRQLENARAQIRAGKN